MKKAHAAFILIPLSLCAEMAQAQSVLQRVLSLLDSPGMIALNLAEVVPQTGFAMHTDFRGIDGSINTTIYGLGARNLYGTEPTNFGRQEAILAVNLGLAEATAIGGVNTGSIGVAPRAPDMKALGVGIDMGVKTALSEAQIARSHAVSAMAGTLGGSGKSSYLAANMSSSAMRVQGQVTNVLQAVSGTMLDIRATGLGAVNTGAIASGIGTTVRGIIGMSGQRPPISSTGL